MLSMKIKKLDYAEAYYHCRIIKRKRLLKNMSFAFILEWQFGNVNIILGPYFLFLKILQILFYFFTY